jgi:hypothetical protein
MDWGTGAGVGVEGREEIGASEWWWIGLELWESIWCRVSGGDGWLVREGDRVCNLPSPSIW